MRLYRQGRRSWTDWVFRAYWNINDFNKLKIDNTNNFLKLINPILLKFSNDEEIAIILQKKDLVVAKTELDITDEVIKIVNSEVKEFKIK